MLVTVPERSRPPPCVTPSTSALVILDGDEEIGIAWRGGEDIDIKFLGRVGCQEWDMEEDEKQPQGVCVVCVKSVIEARVTGTLIILLLVGRQAIHELDQTQPTTTTAMISGVISL